MRKFIVVVILLLDSWAMWRRSLRDIGIAVVVVAIVCDAGVGRLVFGFVSPTRPREKPDRLDG